MTRQLDELQQKSHVNGFCADDTISDSATGSTDRPSVPSDTASQVVLNPSNPDSENSILDDVGENATVSADGSAKEATLEFIAQLIQEQQEVTAVEHFSRTYEVGGVPTQSQFYKSLLPATPPSEGQQYAFEVDLDRCSGCKACVAACHSLNGLDTQETWRDVGLMIGGTSALPIVQHVTTACHHCIDPGCMKACPVDAYEKDPITGIVKHLDDQCFGCQYCTLACPYDVPKYHRGKGIVRKCDMCSDRLADGEAPACVQSCPHEAISITVVDQQQVVEDVEADPFCPARPTPKSPFPQRISKPNAFSLGIPFPQTITALTHNIPTGR